MKQTAVEWFAEQIESGKIEIVYSDKIHSIKCIPEIIQQAKEMEKQQIIDAFVECWKENMPEGYECKQSAEQYYNETFNTKQK
jgi:HEPN domain-containing protein